MLLFTCQDERSLNFINNEGRFINKERYITEHFNEISEFFISKYSWFVEKASNLVEKPNDVNFPIWCSLNANTCMQPVETEIIYILDVPDDLIIIFDGSKWDYVLNNKYIPSGELDAQKYKNYLNSKNITDESIIFNSKNSLYYLQEQNKIYESWSRVFDIKNSDDLYLQANIWEIKCEWILDTVKYNQEIPRKYYK